MHASYIDINLPTFPSLKAFYYIAAGFFPGIWAGVATA
jgi:hypothetical protein